MRSKLLRIVAVCNALLFLGGYVYYRTTGNIFGWFDGVQAVAGEGPQTLLPSSKSAAVVQPSDRPLTMLPGSKSLAPLIPSPTSGSKGQPAFTTTPTTGAGVYSTPVRPSWPSSSAWWPTNDFPKAPLIKFQPTTVSPSPQPAARVLLPSSKSGMIVSPPPPPVTAQPTYTKPTSGQVQPPSLVPQRTK